MKEKVIEALKTKFEGINDDILTGIADKICKTNTTDEEALNAVNAYSLQQVIDSYADRRATQAAQTAIKNYEKAHKSEPNKEITAAKENAETVQDVPQWAQAIIEQNKQFAAQLATFKEQETTEKRAAQLKSIYSKLPKTMQKAYERIQVGSLSDKDFNSLTGEITTEVNTILSETKARGAVFGTPINAGNTLNSEALTKQQEEAISKRGANTADGQPF